jgi:hypothetical protein
MTGVDRVLLIDPVQAGSLEWARSCIPGTEITVIDGKAPLEMWRTLKKSAPTDYRHSVLPFRYRFLTSPRYWAQMLFLLLGARGSPRFATANNRLLTPIDVLKFALPLQPLVSVVLLLRVPLYLLRDVIGKFLLAPRRRGGEPIVGYGAGKGSGGLVYWYNLTSKARKYGALGIAHDTYWGMPLSVHSWPIAVIALRYLGYRPYTLLSTLLLVGAFGICVHEPWAWALVPIILLSTFYVNNVYVGTWELLAWGLGALALTISALGYPVPAGVFLGATLLTHPGVATLVLLSLCVGSFVQGMPFLELVTTGVATAVTMSWFVVPYWRGRRKLGRAQIINNEWGGAKTLSVNSLYRVLTYGVFCGAAFAETKNGLAVAALALPAFIEVFNTRVKWIFSNYTVTNYMLVLGALFTVAHPGPLTIAGYLLVIYAGPWLVTSRAEGIDREYDLTPVYLEGTAERIRKLFAPCRNGRVAFECNGFGGDDEMAVATVAYVLADEPVDLMNSSYAEIGDSALFQHFTRFFKAQATPSELEKACTGAAVRYVVAFGDEFSRLVAACGGRELGRLEDLHISHTPNQAVIDLTLFEMPWDVNLCEGATDLTIGRNEVRFSARAGESYLVKLTCLPGWRAHQGGRRLALQDANPGMTLVADADGEILLHYRYRHYWSS